MNPNQPVLNPVIASSTDATQVANYVKGIILSASSVIVFLVASLFHVSISAGDLTSYATGIGMVVGAIWFLFGLFHKVVAHFGRVR